jgi:hypothetical protein
VPEPDPGGPERTPDGRYLIIDGRRWRASDPTIPEAFRQELVDELMSARRAVGAARGDDDRVRAARARVQDAKVALGERGEPWWETASESGRRDRLAAAVRALLHHREPEKTICPSDAARTVGGDSWRSVMDDARDVAYQLADAGLIEVRQKGEPVDGRSARGPIRLARGPKFPAP